MLTALRRAAAGDYNSVVEGSDDVAAALNGLLSRLGSQAATVLTSVVDTSVAVNETVVQGANLLYGLRRVDDYSQSIAAAAEQMAATVAEIGRSGEEISASALQANESVAKGATALSTVEQEIGKISASVSETGERLSAVHALTGNIATIADTIKKIAAQTNLLAINAAVEAARAGDAGKGFAVVANEVKSLSDRTSAATREIGEIVSLLTDGMQSMMQAMQANTASVGAGATAVGQLGTAMGAIDGNISAVVRNSQDIAIALEQQKEAAESVAGGVARIASHAGKSSTALETVLATMDKGQGAVNVLLGVVAETQVPNRLVKLAQSDHVIWKRRLANMIIGREGLRANELADHHHCRLGKWYDQVEDVRFRRHPAFAALEAPHCRVHQQGIQAVECFNNGDIRGALERISAVETASHEVLDLLGKLEIE
ncbi:methyl-accepting chemotaxis sensory transducer [Ciceribacter lividus]|uniref:Methyl-accepting chemotaxis sensory transducer n=2 Tax=Ciceribacter lividus TaxID=1197950 RepID=A0A6I7HRP6_9HYPH|nr:methyl-accepting chemotaxis sensory transducer [Ciceribacter lividus]